MVRVRERLSADNRLQRYNKKLHICKFLTSFLKKIEFLFYKKSPLIAIFFVLTIHGRFFSDNTKFLIIKIP